MENLIRDYIHSNFVRNGKHIDDQASLFAGNILDSMALSELIYFLEDEFRIVVKPMDVTPNHFDSIQNVVDFVKQKQAG